MKKERRFLFVRIIRSEAGEFILVGAAVAIPTTKKKKRLFTKKGYLKAFFISKMSTKVINVKQKIF
jgi:hypothetical protein